MATKLLTLVVLFHVLFFTKRNSMASAMPTALNSRDKTPTNLSNNLTVDTFDDSSNSHGIARHGLVFPRVDGQAQRVLESYFNVEMRPGAPGSCHRWEAKIRQAWDETIVLVRFGQVGTTLLTSPKPPNTMPERLEEWTRVEQTFQALFGKMDFEINDRKMIDIVAGNFRTIMPAHVAESHRKRPYLRCDQNYFKYVRPETKDPRDAGTREEDMHNFAKPSALHYPCPNGAWVLQGFPREERFWDCEHTPVPQNEDRMMNEICLVSTNRGTTVAKSITIERDASSTAWVQSNRKILNFCLPGLSQPEWSAAAGPSNLRERDSYDVQWLSAVWVHEMFHYILNWRDQPAVDAKGVRALGRTYFWPKAVNLAQYYPGSASISPENMSIFAVTMYLQAWHWASGTAKKEPEGADFDPIKAYMDSRKNHGPTNVNIEARHEQNVTNNGS
ncbi:hypothetical protein BST61_g11415 [Cercospora zeina]